MLRATLSVLLIAGITSKAVAQAPVAKPDSLVAEFLTHGLASSWQPYEIFVHCPKIAPSDSAAFELLLHADLDPWRLSDLALAWGMSLRNCHDPRLEDWFFEHVRQQIEAPNPAYLALWSAIQASPSPRVTAFLRGLLWDASLPPDTRDDAGSMLFSRYEGQARVTEYLQAFEGNVLSPVLGGFQTERAMEIDARRVVSEVLKILDRSPNLANQGAFETFVRQSRRHLGADDLQRASDELASIAQKAPEGSSAHSRLSEAAQWLRHDDPI